MKISTRRIAKWVLWGSAVVTALFVFYASIFFFPYPLFPHRAEIGGFKIYSDQEIGEEFEAVIDDARSRIAAMGMDRDHGNLRIFFCHSQRKFAILTRLAGKRHVGQGFAISPAGNAFLSREGIETIGRRNGGRPVHSRLEGSWAAAIAHEAAHVMMVSEVGIREGRRIPPWKAEGYADFLANRGPAASEPDYDLAERVEYLLNDDHWRPPVTNYDRRHFRWHVLVEYLFTNRGLGFAELLAEDVTEEWAWREMMAWYASLDSLSFVRPPAQGHHGLTQIDPDPYRKNYLGASG